MQYHLNGFRAGDPEDQSSDALDKPRPESVDVLIIGCGPAGLTLAAQLAAFPDITTRIVDQKTGPLEIGQADGIACRTIEMFEAFGFSARVLNEAYWVNETVFWKPDDAQPEHIKRSGRIQDTEDGLSEFPHVILSQARVHDFFLDVMRKSPTGLQPDYARQLIDLQPHKAGVTAQFKMVGQDQHQVINARYVIGCDGARSAVRRLLGHPLTGDSANQMWGVMDVLATTDFPDIRLKAAIHSADEGSMLIIPREGGYMVRLYIELDKLRKNERVATQNTSVGDLIAAAKRILHPYNLEVKQVAWWSVYEIGQRLCDPFDDGTPQPRIFIAGDACHTHSPKAGQGMNVSMADSFNLGWKLASVIRGHAKPELLRSYSKERQNVAQELIEFDRAFARMFSARPKTGGNAGLDPAEFQKYFVKQGRFTAGTAVKYAPSLITGTGEFQHLATGFPIGMRFHSAPVIRLADAKPMHLGHTIKADGRWRLFLFAGGDGLAKIQQTCDFLVKYAPLAEPDSLLDTRAIFQQNHRALALQDMPEFLLPAKGRFGLTDYEKIFCADSSADIFNLRGIDRTNGCMVVVRPDQYVAQILPLDGQQALEAFLGRFLYFDKIKTTQSAADIPLPSGR